MEVKAPIIAMIECRTFCSHSRYRNIKPFLNVVLDFDQIHPILDIDIELYDAMVL